VSRGDAYPGESGGLELRRFAAEDSRAVRELYDSALTAAGAHSGRGASDKDLDSIPAMYLDDGGEFLVGRCDGRVVAMGALRHVTDAVGELKRMHVHPAFQGRGFGQLVLARLEARASELGYRELRLDTTIMQTAAQHLYGSAGYREVGRGQLVGVEVVYFAKSLA
jgi:ribosomal protein S18 acetylase RimI-like enzyme